MHTVAVDYNIKPVLASSTNPVDSIHPYNIPIPSQEGHAPRDDLSKTRKRQKDSDRAAAPEPDEQSGKDGHIDDYA